MSQKIQTMFADIAPTYDQANHALSFNKDILWRKESVEQMGKDGFTPKMVLDLCAGTGDFALAVKEKYPSAKVFLADFATPMLKLAKTLDVKAFREYAVAHAASATNTHPRCAR